MTLDHLTRTSAAVKLLAPRPAVSRFGAILAHVGLASASRDLLADAVELANRFGARLIGVTTPPHGFRLDDVTLSEMDAADHLTRVAGSRFLAASAAVRAGARLLKGAGSAAEALRGLSLSADLIVINHPGDVADPLDERDVEALVVKTGVPVLIRARGIEPARFNHIAILWDGSVACRRAIAGALPFMAQAEVITLLAPAWRSRRVEVEQGLDEARLSLSARGVDIVVARMDRPGPPELAFEHVQALRPDLIVMAGWPERSPWTLISPTDALLPALTTPALVCH